MELGAHLPLIDFGAGPPSPAGLRAYATRASELGYGWLCANDHLLFARPWLDGPTALAATIDASGEMTLATTVLLPVIRGSLPKRRFQRLCEMTATGFAPPALSSSARKPRPSTGRIPRTSK